MFTVKQVREIRRLRKEGHTVSYIADLFGCSKTTIVNVLKKRFKYGSTRYR